MCKLLDDNIWKDFYREEREEDGSTEFNIYNIYEIIDLYKTNLSEREIEEALEKREFIEDAEEADYEIFLDFTSEVA